MVFLYLYDFDSNSSNKRKIVGNKEHNYSTYLGKARFNKRGVKRLLETNPKNSYSWSGNRFSVGKSVDSSAKIGEINELSGKSKRCINIVSKRVGQDCRNSNQHFKSLFTSKNANVGVLQFIAAGMSKQVDNGSQSDNYREMETGCGNFEGPASKIQRETAWKPTFLEVVEADSSSYGWGALYRGFRAGGLWQVDIKEMHINTKANLRGT